MEKGSGSSPLLEPFSITGKDSDRLSLSCCLSPGRAFPCHSERLCQLGATKLFPGASPLPEPFIDTCSYTPQCFSLHKIATLTTQTTTTGA